MLISQRSYELHVSGCARAHEDELQRYRQAKRDNVFAQDADPEYRQWQRNDPIKAEKEIRDLGGTP